MAKTTKKSTRKKSTSKKTARTKSTASKTDGKQLVIVESPAKAKTINKYLGQDYIVLASVGHIRDLPSKNPKGVKKPIPGVDLDNDFKPTYEIINGKGKTVTDLKRAAKNADYVWLATDLDREGEAIAWHLAQALNIPENHIRRVVFNAITKSEIKHAFANPRPLDMDKINAQQARRILDRIVGYQVSPLLWKKVAGGLSAGRVQSVATRLVVEREREIQAFIPDEYWKITAYFTTNLSAASDLARNWQIFLATPPEHNTNNRSSGNTPTLREKLIWLSEHESLLTELIKVNGNKFQPANIDQTLTIAQSAGFSLADQQTTNDTAAKGPAQNRVTLIGSLDPDKPQYTIDSITTKQTTSRPSPPFITSTLQQAAANRIGFTTNTTMRIAQQLYEGIELKTAGSVGLITYMRTDSTHITKEALDLARNHIDENFGPAYLPDKPNIYSSSNSDAQEAHEAIRPTEVSLTPKLIKSSLTDQQYKLYNLIWQRFVSSQMLPAKWDATTVLINAESQNNNLTFKGTGRVLTFDGFYKCTGIPKSTDEATLPKLAENQQLAPLQIDPTQHFTSPPPRFTEASLVRKLEAEGIGRPSTYSAIIQVIQARNYVEKIASAFHATDLGMVVTDKLIEAIPTILDIGYTRDMEAELDAIEEQHHNWVQMLHKFYTPFHANVDKAFHLLTHAKAETQPAPYKCEKCGSPTVYRFGKNGRFLSCSTYPDCKYAAPVDRDGKPQSPQATDIACPICSKPLMLRKGRFGPFLSCPDYPQCDGIINLDKKGNVKFPSPPPLLTDIECEKCGSQMNLRRSKRGPWLSCSAFPKCRGRFAWSKLDDKTKTTLETALTEHENANPQPVILKTDGSPVPENYRPTTIDQSADDSPPTDN